jgi:hypothetical protein
MKYHLDAINSISFSLTVAVFLVAFRANKLWVEVFKGLKVLGFLFVGL